MSLFQADLHCHTTCSDGSLFPVELIQHAKEIGLSGLSITDHDTIEAYQAAIPEAKKLGLLLGTGVEFSCHLGKESVHILGYNYSLESHAIQNYCKRHQERRHERNRAMLDKLARLGKPLQPEDLIAHGTIGRPHMAEAMVKKGYVSSVKEAFALYLAEGRPAYVPGPLFTVQEGIDVIHQAGGKAFISHPHLIANGRVERELVQMPFDGIECYYSRFTLDRNKKWLKIAKERNFLISGGSDFHGSAKPDIKLGCSWVDEETFRKIFD